MAQGFVVGVMVQGFVTLVKVLNAFMVQYVLYVMEAVSVWIAWESDGVRIVTEAEKSKARSNASLGRV